MKELVATNRTQAHQRILDKKIKGTQKAHLPTDEPDRTEQQ